MRDIIKVKDSPYDHRHKTILEIPKVHTTSYGLNSFRYASSHIWNTLPVDIQELDNLCTFKAMLRDWTGPTCTCNICHF